MRGVIGGALALIILERVVQDDTSSRIAPLLALPAAWAKGLLDPTIPTLRRKAA